jgi:hypothetical protein
MNLRIHEIEIMPRFHENHFAAFGLKTEFADIFSHKDRPLAFSNGSCCSSRIHESTKLKFCCGFTKNHFAAFGLEQNLTTSALKKIGPPAFSNGGRGFLDLLCDI